MRKSITHKIEQSTHIAVYYRGKVVIIAQEDSPAIKGFSVRLEPIQIYST